jgi:hypothetical protein
MDFCWLATSPYGSTSLSVSLTLNATPGVQINQQLQNPGLVRSVKVSNGTPFDLVESGFGVKGNQIQPAGTEYMLHAEIENQGTIGILPVNNVGATGTGVIGLTIYFISDTPPIGTWPVPIPTQIVQAKVTTVTDLINDGNVAGHVFLESTVAGAPGSTWSLTNDGNNSFIAVLIANVVHKLIQLANSGNELKLGESGNITEVLGQLLIDQLLTVASQGITVPAATDLVENVPTARKISFQVNAVEQAKVDATGITLPAANKLFSNEHDSLAASNLILNAPTGQQIKAQINATDIVQILAAVVNLLKPLNITITPVTVNGSVSGTVSLYEIIVGSVNIVFIVANNYNSTSAGVGIAFPTPFNTGDWFMWNGIAGVSGNGGIQTVKSAGVVNIAVLSSISAAGGGATVQASIFQNSFGIGSAKPIDSLALNATTSAVNGCMIIIGI